MQLIFATNNQNKVNEIKKVVSGYIDIIPLKEAGIDKDIPEPYDTLQENASTKSKTIFEMTGKDCFSEDTGLEVVALDGAPGVKSARYAGELADNEKNIDKLLHELKDKYDKSAQFRTVISLLLGGKEYFFEGICKGKIIEERRGTDGFGYDSVFIPEGSVSTFAEMTMEEKNKFSHRKKATQQLIDFLNALK